MNKHTQGPWIELQTRIDDSRGYQIAHLDLHGKSEKERDANRRLIAAAPDMLSALQSCYDMIAEECADGEYTEQAKAARAAILKATGEPA